MIHTEVTNLWKLGKLIQMSREADIQNGRFSIQVHK